MSVESGLLRVQTPPVTEQNPPPDWYPAPHDPAGFDRYWDGTEWTGDIRKAQEPGFLEQIRSLPLWVALVVPAFVAIGIFWSHPEVSNGSIKTVHQAVLAFEKHELRQGIPGQLSRVECRPGQEAYSCSGVESHGKDVLLKRGVFAKVTPGGSVDLNEGLAGRRLPLTHVPKPERE